MRPRKSRGEAHELLRLDHQSFQFGADRRVRLTRTCRDRATRSVARNVLSILDVGISVITAVNIQHIESLNDIIARTTGVKVRETVPGTFFKRADGIIDVSTDTLRTRLRQRKIYAPEKIEQALNNFFRKGNLATLHGLALRQVALHQSVQDHEHRELEGLEPATIPEKVMVCMASRGSAAKLLRTGARIVGRHAYRDWYAVYVETPNEEPGRISPDAHAALQENIRLAGTLGATVVKLKSSNVSDALLKFASEHEITQVIFGHPARNPVGRSFGKVPLSIGSSAR